MYDIKARRCKCKFCQLFNRIFLPFQDLINTFFLNIINELNILFIIENSGKIAQKPWERIYFTEKS